MLIHVLLALALQSPGPAASDRVGAAVEAAVRASPDGSDFGETAAWRDLVGALLELKPVDVEARGPTPLDVARALADPTAARGTWVRVRGRIKGQRDIVLVPPLGSTRKVVRAILLIDRDTAVACDLIGDPPPYNTRTDTVEISGVFFRTVGFEDQSGKHATLPYVLVRSMELVDTPGSALGKSLVRGGSRLFGGVALGLVGVILLVWYLRRSARS